MMSKTKTNKKIWTSSIYPAVMAGILHAWFSGLSKRLDILAGEFDTPKVVRDANWQELMPDVILNAIVQGVIIAVCIYFIVAGIQFLVKRNREKTED